MSNNTLIIDLATRYAAAFGMMAINRQLHTAVVERDNGDYGFEFYGGMSSEVERLTFKNGANVLTFAGMLNEVDGIFAPPLMIDFSREKQLIETEVNGSDNIIIERWGTKAWALDIKGILVDVEHRIYPQDKIKELVKFFESNDIIEVDGVQFDDKEIDSLYFKDIRITPVEGYQDTVQFSITASSIQPVEFNVLNLK